MNIFSFQISLASSVRLITFLVCFALFGCDGTNPVAETPSPEPAPMSEADIDYVRTIPHINKNGDSSILIHVAVREGSPWRRYLGGLRILPRTSTGKTVIIRDDGRDGDERAGDGVFSGFVSHGCIELPNRRPVDQIKIGKEIGFSCTIKFVGPGGDCGEYGTCPERIHRSALWGLIQYSTDVIVCFCLTECTFSND